MVLYRYIFFSYLSIGDTVGLGIDSGTGDSGCESLLSLFLKEFLRKNCCGASVKLHFIYAGAYFYPA